MKFLHLLPLAGAAIGFVIPEQDLLESEVFSENREQDHSNALDCALENGHGHGVLPDVSALKDRFLKNVVDSLNSASPAERPESSGHHGKSNYTVYELITKSKYTTKLAELVKNDTELVDVLNKTDASLTLFAPTDKAFEKIPKHGDHKPSKELIKRVLLNHISGDFYPAGKVLKTYTIPTLLEEERLGGPQRLTVKAGVKGLTLNYFSKVVAADIFAANGVIHGVDNIVFLPIPTLPVIEITPSAFSTLAFGLAKTGLFKELGDAPHIGSTFFAPPNWAFRALGPKINAFLFSKFGTKYLKALIQYHVVLNATLYSDAYYHGKGYNDFMATLDQDDVESTGGHYHLDLPTLLADRAIPVDINSFGPFIKITVNGQAKVVSPNTPTKDGVIHVVDRVLIPPKKGGPGDGDDETAEEWDGETELEVEDLKDRLAPLLDEADEDDEGVDMTFDAFDDEVEDHDDITHNIEDMFAGWSHTFL